jgi:hypothetical protein
VIALLLVASVVAAAEPCEGTCETDVACALVQARCLLDHDALDEALKVLKGVRGSATPGSQAGAVARLLSLAYDRAGNGTWARRILAEQVAADPSDRETRSWAAWRALQDGDVAGAKATLAIPPSNDALGQRFRLLDAALAELEGRNAEAEAAVLAVKPPLLPGDDELQTAVRSRVLGDAGEPFSVRIEAGLGYSTNPVQSAPQDIGGGTPVDVGSPVANLDTVLRWEPFTSLHLRPVGEVRVKGLFPTAAASRPSAWLDLGGRAGAEIGRRTSARGRLYYSFELLGVNSGDEWTPGATEMADSGTFTGQRWYMEAHRGEIEVDVSPRVQVFGGAGRRVFRDEARTRNEIDGGAALVLPVGSWNLTGVLSGRGQDAQMPEWNLLGGSALLRVATPLPGSGLLLTRGLALLDRYEVKNPDGRKDVTMGLQVAPWTRSFAGVRFGVSWTFTDRMSTAEEWSYEDHRFLVEIRWQEGWGHRTPPEAPVGEGYVPLPYGPSGSSDTGLDRVQDLLHQEDSARRGSSCVD